jgi:lipopolysaccharide export LptBFGC system permease protein LptF
VGNHLAGLFSIRGLHDLQSGFSLLLPLAAMGAWWNARHRYHAIPVVVAATVPLALALALLSGNAGRMFFAAFPAVIAYALIAVEHVLREGGSR